MDRPVISLHFEPTRHDSRKHSRTRRSARYGAARRCCHFLPSKPGAPGVALRFRLSFYDGNENVLPAWRNGENQNERSFNLSFFIFHFPFRMDTLSRCPASPSLVAMTRRLSRRSASKRRLTELPHIRPQDADPIPCCLKDGVRLIREHDQRNEGDTRQKHE